MTRFFTYSSSLLYRFCMLFVFAILAIASVQVTDINDLIMKAEEHMALMNEDEALETYLQILELDPVQYQALWNASLLYASVGYRYEDDHMKKMYFERAVEHAEKAVQAHPDRGHPYYVMAVAKGRMTDIANMRSRIRLAYTVEENVKKSLEIMPDYAPSWHLYGVWHSEVANVGRAERLAARFISRGLPEGSNQKAEKYLKKAAELDPESILIRLDLARHFIRSGQKSNAVNTLEQLFESDPQPRTKDDSDHLKEAVALRNSL